MAFYVVEWLKMLGWKDIPIGDSVRDALTVVICNNEME